MGSPFPAVHAKWSLIFRFFATSSQRLNTALSLVYNNDSITEPIKLTKLKIMRSQIAGNWTHQRRLYSHCMKWSQAPLYSPSCILLQQIIWTINIVVDTLWSIITRAFKWPQVKRYTGASPRIWQPLNTIYSNEWSTIRICILVYIIYCMFAYFIYMRRPETEGHPSQSIVFEMFASKSTKCKGRTTLYV